MSLWGNVDSGTVTGTLTATNASATVTGFTNTTTDSITTGDILVMADVPYRVKTVDSTSQVTLTKVYAGSTGNPATVRRNPPRHLGDVEANAIFGVDNTEASSGEDNIVEVALVTAGTGYVNDADAVPTISGGGGASATATASVTAGKVTGFTITDVGASYETVPGVTCASPTASTFAADSAVSTANNTITLSAPQIAALAVDDAVVYSDGGGTQIVGLVDGTTYYIESIAATEVTLSATVTGAVLELTSGAAENHTLTGVPATATAALGTGGGGITPGWVKRTAGTGGRAGRVHYETLVASGTITGDHENIRFPA